MRKSDHDDDRNSIWGFTSLFTTAVVYGALLRILDVFILVTSTDNGYATFWLEPAIGFLSLGDLILSTALFFLGLAIYELIGKFRSFRNWITLVTCLLLVVYALTLCLNVRNLAS